MVLGRSRVKVLRIEIPESKEKTSGPSAKVVMKSGERIACRGGGDFKDERGKKKRSRRKPSQVCEKKGKKRGTLRSLHPM